MGNKPQLYKFTEIEHRLHTLEPGKSYIKPFVTSEVSDTMCGGLNFLHTGVIRTGYSAAPCTKGSENKRATASRENCHFQNVRKIAIRMITARMTITELTVQRINPAKVFS